MRVAQDDWVGAPAGAARTLDIGDEGTFLDFALAQAGDGVAWRLIVLSDQTNSPGARRRMLHPRFIGGGGWRTGSAEILRCPETKGPILPFSANRYIVRG